MHLPLAHLSGYEEQEDEELHAQLQAHSGSQHSLDDEDGSQSHSHSQGSKEGSGASAPDGSKPPKDLPCPRCQSMNTKFCYYNNYSVNQPRHFCRNCQRYWTVGGTLRNVPVGGGSRKKSRTRSRSDPYYRPGSSPAPADSDGGESDAHHAAMAGAMAGMSPLHGAEGAFDAGFADFPFHPSQIATFLQLALHQNSGLGMGMGAFPPPFPMASAGDDEAFYKASQGDFLGSMMSAGLFMPEQEPAHMALMYKATLMAEAQRLQTMARRQSAAQAAAWASEERECKPAVAAAAAAATAVPLSPNVNPAMEAELRRQQSHRRPGFWETALMHSRPSSKSARPGSSSQIPWDGETKPLAQQEQERPHDLNEESAKAATAFSSQGGYVDETTSWGSGLSGTPEMYY